MVKCEFKINHDEYCDVLLRGVYQNHSDGLSSNYDGEEVRHTVEDNHESEKSNNKLAGNYEEELAKQFEKEELSDAESSNAGNQTQDYWTEIFGCKNEEIPITITQP